MTLELTLHREPSNGLYYSTLGCPGYDMRYGKATPEEALQYGLARFKAGEAEIYRGIGMADGPRFLGIFRADGTWL